MTRQSSWRMAFACNVLLVGGVLRLKRMVKVVRCGLINHYPACVG